MRILVFFLILIILFLGYLLVRPMFKRKFTKTKWQMFDELTDIEEDVKKAAIRMACSDKTLMAFDDDRSLYKKLAVIKNRIRGKRRRKNYAYFNFPRAWLLNGLLEYGQIKNQTEIINLVRSQTKKLIHENGSLKFRFDKIDQTLFGLLFINLYRETGEIRYQNATEQIYRDAQKFKTKEGLYRYRQKDNVLFIDTIGMICPFLYAYANLKEDNSIRQDANYQVDAFLKYTIPDSTGIKGFPPHAYDLDNNLRLGSVNWGRGLGWFMMGLAYAAKSNPENNPYIGYFHNHWRELTNLSISHFWPQFLGHTNDETIDTSATLMFYWAEMTITGKYNDLISNALHQSIDLNGAVIKNSGDTIYINNYSRIKGKSELAQGLLLSILAKKVL